MAHLVKACVSPRSSMLFNSLRSSTRAFSSSSTPEKSETNAILSNKTHKVNDFERQLLVWSGKYKTKDEIPSYVAPESVDKARNKFRIKVANYMMFLTLIGCAIMIMAGKKAAEKGESVLKMNQDWHSEYNQKAIEEATAKAQK